MESLSIKSSMDGINMLNIIILLNNVHEMKSVLRII